MTNSKTSNSEPYNLLHRSVQRWVYNQGWRSLRDVQNLAIPHVLACEHDVILSAPTAGGKTEAAWLPICSRLATDAETLKPGIKALYIGPLKALINDQANRLESLFQAVNLPVSRRHGDIHGAEREALEENPDGLLLITPESLEALFVGHGPRVPEAFAGLQYIVIDELHSFIGTERGAQLQSLLHRLELATRKRIVRVGLSATIADLRVAADFMRPREGEHTIIIEGTGGQTATPQLHLNGYLESETETETATPSHVRQIAEDVYETCRLTDNLVFTNSRRDVELYAAELRKLCETHHTPMVFYPHHGSLQKSLREDVERLLKSAETPTTAICTSTLEMGIDIGSADAIGQIDPPSRVASIRQRMGRSGRRGSSPVLHLYIAERTGNPNVSLPDQLRMRTFQTLAVVQLMLVDKWYEPPDTRNLHLSTLIQQILSTIAQHSGASAKQLYGALCGWGPFQHITQSMFLQLLRDLGAADVLMQSSTGTLLPAPAGEKLINHYSFFTAFATAEEYRLEVNGRTIGTLPVEFPMRPGGTILFAGKRWEIQRVLEREKVVLLHPSQSGEPPAFGGSGPRIADGIRRKMREIYLQTDVPDWCNTQSRTCIVEGRTRFQHLGLGEQSVIPTEHGCAWVPFRGDMVLDTVDAMLATRDVNSRVEEGVILVRKLTPEQLREVALELAENLPENLADTIQARERDRHDALLGPELMSQTFTNRDLDIEGANELLRSLAANP